MECPICNRRLVDDFQTPKFKVRRCLHCAHRIAEFAPLPSAPIDYHEKHGEADFVEALGVTRLRQAQKILAWMKKLSIPFDNLFDFGAGRAWFVRALIEKRARNVAGADSSDLSLGIVTELGAAAVRCQFTANDIQFTPPPFEIRTVSFLDVIEHFRPEEINSAVSSILARFPTLTNVIIKVPVSEGFFYRLASAARHIRQVRWIEQLFQVGSDIPHYHYFSRASLKLFIEKQGLNMLMVEDDEEVDDIAGRLKIKSLHKVAGVVVNGVLKSLAKAIGCDARIAFTRRT